ncbi:hypothetical protein [Nocardia araoensis]|uniref:hypothetical protein n=1 Tax=Nocardia araoensis TaxID=228600 RepID=UPI0002D83858|nr:hypothetical protein [Nocardia araoensis]
MPHSTPDRAAPVVRIVVGAPTYRIALHYVHLYDKKPFPDTDLHLYDNGVYWLSSEGENHFGVYVLTEGSVDCGRFTMRFISLPSADWGDTVAYHELEFDVARGVFTQLALADTDPDIPELDGTFAITANTVADPTRGADS